MRIRLEQVGSSSHLVGESRMRDVDMDATGERRQWRTSDLTVLR